MAERMAVIAVNPGTQAERHRQLAPGLLLLRVAGEDVVGKSYQEVLAELKTAGRPLTMTFEPGPSGAASPRPAPAAQYRQMPMLLYWPGAQGRHCAFASSGWVPGWHAAHSIPSVLCVPSGHSSHSGS